MKRATTLVLLGVLFLVVWPVQGQTPTTAADYIARAPDEMARLDEQDEEPT